MDPHTGPLVLSAPLSSERRSALYQVLEAVGVGPPGPLMFAKLLGGLRAPEHLGLLKPSLPSSSIFHSGGKGYEVMQRCYAGNDPAARFLGDLMTELCQQCTDHAYPVTKEVDYFKTENYTRILSNIDPLVEQVRKEIPNHLCSFGNIKQILDILLIIELIAHQQHKLLFWEIVISLEDIEIMSDCLFHFVMQAFNDPQTRESAASRKQALSQIIERPARVNARAPAVPGAGATFSSASSFLPPFPRSVPVPSSQAPQPLGASDPWPNDLFPESHLPRGFQVQTEPQSAFHAEIPSSSSQQSTPCQIMAEALKRYTEINTATKAECLGVLTKQEESRQQLQVAFQEFLHSEAVLHGQAEQKISALFDAAGATSDHITYPRSPGDASAAPPSFSPGAPLGSRPANAQGRWASSAILPESLSPGYAPSVMYPPFAPLHPSPSNNANFMNPPALGPNPYSYSPPYPVPPPLGNLFTPPSYPTTTGSFPALSPYAAWPMSVGPGAYYGSTFSAPQTFRHAQPPFGGASASFGTLPRWETREPHGNTSNWKAPSIPPTIPNATSHTAPYAKAASQHRSVPPTGSSSWSASSPYYPFYSAPDSSQRSPRTCPAALFTPPPPPPMLRVPDSADSSRCTSPYINLPDLSSYVMPPLESSSDIPGLQPEFSDVGTPRREPLSPITERTSQTGSEAVNGEQHRVRIVELKRSPYLPRAPEAPGHSSNAHGNGPLRMTSPSISSPIYVAPSPIPHANTPPQPSRVEVDSSVSELVTDSEPSVLSSPTSDNALFREAERGGWYFPTFPPNPLVINSVPVIIPPSPSPRICGSTQISVSPPPGVRDYETTDMSRSTSSPIASSASNPLPPSQLSTQLQFSHLFCDDNRSPPPPPVIIQAPPRPPSSSERIEKIKGRFDELKQAFSFSRFVDVSMDGSTSKTVDTTALYATTLMECALNNGNHLSMLTGKRYRMLPFGSEGGRRVHQYSKDLDDVLLELDGVWCGDDAAAKAKRKEVVDEVVKEANVLDQWKDMICKMADVQQ